MTGDQEQDVSGLEPEAIAAMIELAEDYLSVDELHAELREFAGRPVAVWVALEGSSTVADARGVLHLGEHHGLVTVGSLTLTLIPDRCEGGFWNGEGAERVLYARLSETVRVIFDFNAREGD